MSFFIDSTIKDVGPWMEAFRVRDPAIKIYREGDKVPLDQITTAVVWNHRPGLFLKFPNLKLIASMGAGVDHILSDPSIPSSVIITRIVSDTLSGPMSNFCIGAVLYHQRQFDKYLSDKVQKIWHHELNPELGMNIGIMGLGALGMDLANKLNSLGFNVFGYSKSKKEIPDVVSFTSDQLQDFLNEINVLVVMLPATPETKAILSKPLFAQMKRGTYLINVARGHHQVDQDIIDAIEDGQLSGAFLDVFPKEPLSADSPLWAHPKVMITPHIAVVTKIEAAVPQIISAHYRVLEGELPEIVVDKLKGY